MRTCPARSVTKRRPSGAMSTAHGARNPDATSCTFSTTAAPIRGDGVGVGLAVAGGGVVGIGIVVARLEELAAGGAAHDRTRSGAMRTAIRARGAARARGLCTSRGFPGAPPRGVSGANDAHGGEGAASARPRAQGQGPLTAKRDRTPRARLAAFTRASLATPRVVTEASARR